MSKLLDKLSIAHIGGWKTEKYSLQGVVVTFLPKRSDAVFCSNACVRVLQLIKCSPISLG